MTKADVTWRQISANAKMACGARNPMSSDEGRKLTFKVGRSAWIEVTLQPDDLYLIEKVRMGRAGRIIDDSRAGVFVEDLDMFITELCLTP